MRRDWDDAARPRSDTRQPPPRASRDGAGMPLPQRRHVAPAVPPAGFGAYVPPAPPMAPPPAQAAGARGAERVLRRVDGTPIRDTRAKPARRHAAPRPTTPDPAPPLDYKSVDYALGVPIVTPAYTDYPDIILELPPTALEQHTPSRRERPAPRANVPPLAPRPTPPVVGSNRALAAQRQALVPPPVAQRSAAARPLPKTLPQSTLAPYGEAELAPLAPGVCPQCRGAGYLRLDVPIGHHSFGKAVPCICKETELEQRRRDELWRLSSLDAFQEMTFERFNPHVPGTREAWEAARRYAENPDGWLVLSGSCGSGKTHLAAAIANMQFELGTMVLFTVVPHLLDHLRAAFAPSSETTYDALFDKVCQAGLLVLDDLGAEHSTPWAQEKLFQIINHRYMYHYPTVITTNLDLINDIDDRVRSRLTDISLVRHIRVDATDYRPHHVPPRRMSRG